MFTKYQNFIQIIKAILFFIITNILLSFTYALCFKVTNEIYISYLISYSLLVIALITYRHKDLKEDFKNIKSDYKNKIVNIIILTLIFYLLVIVSNWCLYQIIGNLATNEDGARKLFLESPIIMFITMGFLAPIFEELVLRYPYRNINVNKYLKLFLYNFIFAIMHITNIVSIDNLLFIIPYLFLSLEISYAYFKTNNIYGSIIIHIINNVVSLILILI